MYDFKFEGESPLSTVGGEGTYLLPPMQTTKLRHYSLSFNSCMIMYYHWQTFFFSFFWREYWAVGEEASPCHSHGIVDRTLTDSRINMQEHWYSATMLVEYTLPANLL